MPLFRSKAEAKVAEAGYDPARLPPGQYLTEKWPVLHAGSVPKIDLSPWDLRIFGEVENEVTLNWEQLLELPSRELTIDIHCVTRWSRFDMNFKGVHWSELAKLVSPKPSRELRRRPRRAGLHRQRPARGDRGRERADRLRGDGEPLTPDHGWPVRLFVPSRYFWKSAKWLRGIELLHHDRPGFWERYGYNNNADYWKEERYSF